jgi:hypothetical protein
MFQLQLIVFNVLGQAAEYQTELPLHRIFPLRRNPAAGLVRSVHYATKQNRLKQKTR